MVALAVKEQKQVQIIDRNERPNNYVFYRVLSSNGKDIFATTLHDGRAIACTCPAYKACYHKTQLERIENSYRLLASGHHVQLVNGKFVMVRDNHRAYSSKDGIKVVCIEKDVKKPLPVEPVEAEIEIVDDLNELRVEEEDEIINEVCAQAFAEARKPVIQAPTALPRAPRFPAAKQIEGAPLNGNRPFRII